jgi:DNA-binding NtrC family response regulator
MQALTRYDWPGNVRELMNVIERAILLSKGGEITMGELPEVLHNGNSGQPERDRTELVLDRSQWLDKTLPEVKEEFLDQVEKLYLEAILQHTGGRIARTAEIAGIHPRGLYNKMKRHNLRKEDYKK